MGVTDLWLVMVHIRSDANTNTKINRNINTIPNILGLTGVW